MKGLRFCDNFTAKNSLYQVLLWFLDLTIETACVCRKGIVLTASGLMCFTCLSFHEILEMVG